MSRHPVKVLFIIGWGRSGSTLIDNILGQIDPFFSAGEMHYVWDHLALARPCGCRRPITQCPVWSEVACKVRADVGEVEPQDVVALQRRALRLRHTAGLLQPRLNRPTTRAALDRYASIAASTYGAIAAVTGKRVVVDSTKRPPDAALLRSLPGVELYLLHLVRDPRAVAHSWQRRRPQLDRPTDMDRYGPASSSVHWVTWNLAAEAIRALGAPDRYLLVRYEDFVRAPRDTVARMVELVGEEGAELPFLDASTVRLEANHTVAGNPGRFRTGVVTIEEDREWQRQQPLRDRAASTAVSLPLLHRYGYRVRYA